MNVYEWEDITKPPNDDIITIDDLKDKSNRVLIFGKYKLKNRYRLTYIYDGKIYNECIIGAEEDYKFGERIDLKIIENYQYVDYISCYTCNIAIMNL